MTSIDYNELLERVVALEIEALNDIGVTADAKPYFIHTQEAFPYFTNRIGDDTVAYDSEDFDRDTLNVVMRLIIGHMTEGYIGEPETTLYTCIPALKTYFNERDLLQSGLFPVATTGLIEARIVGHSGFRIFANSGLQAQQVGTEITLQCQYDESIESEYT